MKFSLEKCVPRASASRWCQVAHSFGECRPAQPPFGDHAGEPDSCLVGCRRIERRPGRSEPIVRTDNSTRSRTGSSLDASPASIELATPVTHLGRPPLESTRSAAAPPPLLGTCRWLTDGPEALTVSRRSQWLAGEMHECGQNHQGGGQCRRGADHEQQAQAPDAPMMRD